MAFISYLKIFIIAVFFNEILTLNNNKYLISLSKILIILFMVTFNDMILSFIFLIKSIHY